MTPQRKKPLARSGKPLRRSRLKSSRKRIRQRRADPAKRGFAKRRCQEYLDWLKTQPCSVTGRFQGDWRQRPSGFFMWWVDPAHLKTRATGGDDLYNAISLARHLHSEQRDIGWPAFERKYGIDAKQIAAELTERFLAEHPSVAARLAQQYTEEM